MRVVEGWYFQDIRIIRNDAMTENKPEAEPIKPEPLPLLSPVATTLKATYTTPNILVSVKDDEGAVTKSIREGGPRQIDYTTEVSWSEASVNEKSKVFAIHTPNRINFAGGIINVINDETDYGDTHLAPTSPTASEYMAAREREKVLVHFDCQQDLNESRRLNRIVYKVSRTTVKLP